MGDKKVARETAPLDPSEAMDDDRKTNGNQTPEVAPDHSSIDAALHWFDQACGPPWSFRSLRIFLGLALVYCWIAYFLGWGLGGSGNVGDIALLANPDQPARLLGALSAIGFPLAAMLIGRFLGRSERSAKLRLLRWWRRNPKQFRKRLRLHDFERRYRWFLGLAFGLALVSALIWFRRGDVAAFAIVFSWLALGPVSGIAVARRFSTPTSQGLAALAAGFGSITGAVLLILAFAGAGVSAFAFAILGVTNVAFAGAIGVLLDLIMGGVFTIGLALAGAGVATVALALAGAGTGIATLTGVATMSRAGLAAFIILMSGATVATLAFREATVLSAAIGGISALAVAAAVSHNRMGHHGAYAGAIGAIGLLIITAVLLGWGDSPLVIFAFCFFLMLPMLVGLSGWFALAMLRSLARIFPMRRAGILTLAALMLSSVIGLGSMAGLAYLLGYGAESYNQLTLMRSGILAFDSLPMIDAAVADPLGEGAWLVTLLLFPVLPMLFLASRAVTDRMFSIRSDGHLWKNVVLHSLGASL
ncbi:MAG: hypothetical protein AAFO01_10465, partial [Pseudomonadota bacterium]